LKEIFKENMKITVSRKAHFNAAHKICNKKWSKKENIKIFGKCSNENFHGHNYELIVKIYGEINKSTGMVIDLGLLKKIIKKEIEDKLDHKNLNLDISYFKDIMPTTENLAIYIWGKLKKAIDLDCKITVKLYETPRNFVEYSE
jgi:6-pyruvoyltetrahydropterin/6-carboxytetrahydropterin synthase